MNIFSLTNFARAQRGLRAVVLALLALQILSSDAAAAGLPYTVALRREFSRAVAESPPASAFAAAGKVFHVGRILVGRPRPQELRVIFDVASGQVILPTTRCSAAACLEHSRYDPVVSETSVDINGDGTLVQGSHRLASDVVERDALTVGLSSIDLGEGEATGELIFDRVCFSSDGHAQNGLCTDLGLVAATNLTDVPFRAMPQDGTMGLGLPGLSVSPLFSLLERLSQGAAGAAPGRRQFGLFLGALSGELTLGGHSEARLAAPLEWAPVVNPEVGYWQLAIRALRVGNVTLRACQDGLCTGIVDNGASRIGAPKSMAADLLEALRLSCSELHIDLAGGPTLTLPAEDYAVCGGSSGIAELDLPDELASTLILGEPVLRRYYSVFDWEARRVGFGLARPETAAEAEAGAAAAEAEAAALPVPEATAEPVGLVLVLLRALGLQVFMVFALAAASNQRGGGWTPQRLLGAIDKALLRGRGLDAWAGLAKVPCGEAPEADECAICLGSCEEAGAEGPARPPWRRLRCGHKFHEECIHQWLQKAKQCPVCRAPAWGGSGGSGGRGGSGGAVRQASEQEVALATAMRAL